MENDSCLEIKQLFATLTTQQQIDLLKTLVPVVKPTTQRLLEFNGKTAGGTTYMQRMSDVLSTMDIGQNYLHVSITEGRDQLIVRNRIDKEILRIRRLTNVPYDIRVTLQ